MAGERNYHKVRRARTTICKAEGRGEGCERLSCLHRCSKTTRSVWGTMNRSTLGRVLCEYGIRAELMLKPRPLGGWVHGFCLSDT